MTYSIVARDSVTGVGAVATQANADVAYGPRALALMAAGRDASSALAELLAEDAGEAQRQVAGGDARGRQSAAMLIVPADGEPWRTTVSLRVEDHPEPLVELRRLLALHAACALATCGDEAMGEARFEDAARLYEEAGALEPGNHELLFWAGLGAAEGGDVEAGADKVRAAIQMHPGWAELLERLTPDVAPSAAAVLARLREQT